MLIPRFRPSFGLGEVLAALSPQGEAAVEAFEQEFARRMGVREAVAFAYGRSALAALLQALGLREAEIICPAYTCVVVPHAIVHSGNEPVFVDAQADDWNMDLALVEAAITPKTRAILATSLFGRPVDAEGYEALAARHPNVHLIMDCALAIGASHQGRPVHQAGLAAFFGLNAGKQLCSIFGGMATTDDPAFAATLRQTREQMLRPKSAAEQLKRRLYLLAAAGAFSSPGYTAVDWLSRLGLMGRFTNYHQEGVIDVPEDWLTAMCPAEAAVGRAQLKKLDAMQRRRREACLFYYEALQGVRGLRLPARLAGEGHSHFCAWTTEREALRAFTHARGVELGRLFEYCVPEMQAYANRPGVRFPHPNASRHAAEVINLPVTVSPAQASRVAETVREFFRAGR